MPFVAFELFGTLCTFDKVVQKIEAILNKQYQIHDKQAKNFFYNWYNTALRDYIATSFAGRYCPLKKVLKATLERALINEGYTSQIDEDRFLEALDAMEPSSDAIEALNILSNKKEWDIWILSTSGNRSETIEFLKRMNMIDYIDTQNILCCDDLCISRPHPKVYSELMRMAVHRTKRIENFYLISTYAFDLASAKNMSFRTVFLNTHEKIYAADMYSNGGPNIIGNNLVHCIQEMIDYEKTKKFL
ncbi:hypothetical protein RMCBS344292_17113 [Rhizopus microsporus]|nr:hypothetical protein RMCBS344292_17113 [Rhizopus microsporus]